VPDSQVDLAPGRLTGYRRWKVVGNGTEDDPYRLTSLVAGTVWPWIPQMRATCRRMETGAAYMKFRRPVVHDPKDVPNAECSCGVYASYELDRPSEPRMVCGAIEAWGPTVIGDLAFRARHARLVGLCLDAEYMFTGRRWEWPEDVFRPLKAEPPDMLTQLGELYRVPIFRRGQDLETAFPASDVSALLPPKPPAPAPPPSPSPKPTRPSVADIMARRIEVIATTARSGSVGNTAGAFAKSTGFATGGLVTGPTPSPNRCWCGRADCTERQRPCADSSPPNLKGSRIYRPPIF
jgi:hypothetical protein